MLPKFISNLFPSYIRVIPYKIFNRKEVFFFFVLITLPLLVFVSFTSRILRSKGSSPRLLWGVDNIINDSYFANALKNKFKSHSLARRIFSINNKTDFDLLIGINPYINYFYAVRILFSYDIFHLSFNGGLLSKIGLGWIEPLIFKLAGVKVVSLGYGSDIGIYDKINNIPYVHTLMCHYPVSISKRNQIERNIFRWCKNAHIIIPAMFASNGFPRWDLVMPNTLVLDTKRFGNRKDYSKSNKVVKIIHTPNHRIIKGTEYIEKTINELKQEGYPVELVVLEKMKNEEVMNILLNEADILVEKIVGPSYALSGIEGMACGLPVISNINSSDWEGYMKLFYRYSFLKECPIITGNIESLKDVLIVLIRNPELRKELGKAGRKYVEKYHSYNTAQYVFGKIYDKIWYNKEVDLMNIFHPLNPDSYNNQSPMIRHPLIENKLPENYFSQHELTNTK